MTISIQEWQEKIDARNIRERSLLFLCALAVVFLLWNLLVQSSLDKNEQLLSAQLKDLKTQRQSLETQVTAIAHALSTDPNLEQKNHIIQLKSQINALDVQLGGLSQGLVSADDLPGILQEMLAKTTTLSLTHVQTLPVEELPLTFATQNKNSTSEEISAGIFKHGVVLRVSGSYFQLLEFLHLLETSSWRFYWEQLDYRVTTYPNADILLRVYTLGAEKGRLGV